MAVDRRKRVRFPTAVGGSGDGTVLRVDGAAWRRVTDGVT
jgi:hypothetical protein